MNRVGTLGIGACLLNVAFTLAGCHHKSDAPPSDAEDAPLYLQEPKRLDPFHVRAVPSERDEQRPSVQQVEIYDAGALFRRASALFRLERYTEARSLFLRVSGEFHESAFAAPSLYNAGLCAEHNREFSFAWMNYETLIQQYPHSKDVSDALFRIMGCAEALETWEEVVSTADVLLKERLDITSAERVECLARKGAALVELEDDLLAAASLKEALYRYRQETGEEEKIANYYAAMARFKLGEISARKMHRAPLPADESLLQEALETKCKLLLDAQVEYTGAVRLGNAHWAAAAAYRIGKLYRILWQDMMEAPPPEDLTEEEREIYFDIMRKRIEVLLKKALAQWERVVKMSERLDFRDEWTEKAHEEIEEIKTLLKQDVGSQSRPAQ